MKKLIVRIAEGLGNQMFMYANSYSLSKKMNYRLFIDNTSGYFKEKNKVRSYELDSFNVLAELSEKQNRFDNHHRDLKRKILKKIDIYKKNKSFIIEKIDNYKKTSFKNYAKEKYNDLLFLEGHYESEKYFIEYSDQIKKQFTLNNKVEILNNKFIDILKSTNSVSICIRQNRYSERGFLDINKSDQFTHDTINYIKNSIQYFKNKIENPQFFIWSNDFSNLTNYFNLNKYTFIDNKINKTINDFNLFRYCKHFIVGPTPFHWWGAWLNENPSKICLRPLNINSSNNKDFWPDKWIGI